MAEKKKVLLGDLDKCIGCYVCEVGCQEWHQIDDPAQKRLMIRSIGPVKVDQKMHTLYLPEINERCDFCQTAQEADEGPFCVSACPVNAISYCDYQEALIGVKDKNRQILKIDSGGGELRKSL